MELTESEFFALRQGDPKVFEKLYLQYEKLVYNFLLAKTKGDAAVVEEVFSETFLSAFRSLPTLKNKANIQGWLLQIASRRLSDHLRKTYRENDKQRSVLPTDQASADVLDHVLRLEKKAMFDLALERLKPEQRRVLKLKYYDEKSVEEIAGLFGEKESTIEGLLHRARQSLKRALEDLSYV
jgi:RNA polymerase sigma-70 factor (ECF subfamily)